MRPFTKQQPELREERRRILVVDDEPLMLDMVTMLLEPDFDVIALDDSTRAWQLLRDGARFDAIVSDLCMPELDGRELYERILQLDPAQAERFVILTGGATDDEGHAFLERLDERLIHKPFSSEGFRRFVSGIARMGPPANDCEEAGASRRVRSGN